MKVEIRSWSLFRSCSDKPRDNGGLKERTSRTSGFALKEYERVKSV